MQLVPCVIEVDRGPCTSCQPTRKTPPRGWHDQIRPSINSLSNTQRIPVICLVKGRLAMAGGYLAYVIPSLATEEPTQGV
jgi:hypothetical protein